MNPALLTTWNELEKELRIRWSYKFSIVVEAVMMVSIFLGITFFMTEGDLQSAKLAPALVGYIIWFYALLAIGKMSWGLREETQTGTLEQMYMSTMPMGLLLIGRTIATVIITTFEVTVALSPSRCCSAFGCPGPGRSSRLGFSRWPASTASATSSAAPR